jgi:hypothetical protein
MGMYPGVPQGRTAVTPFRGKGVGGMGIHG